jgi:AraC family transcriptional activator of pobA
MPKTPPLPAYALYGEHGPPLDPLHSESIAARSQRHGWEIRPHRHAALFQWLVIVQGGCRAWLEGEPVELAGPAFVTVPALAAHGFVFAPGVQGWVFTVAEPHLAALLRPHAGLAASVMQLRADALPAANDLPADAARLHAQAQAQAQAHGPLRWHAAALEAALLQLAVASARARPEPMPALGANAPGPRALAHVQRLRALVESQYRRQPAQAALAAQLGITPTQLNRACRQVLGHPAQGVLHARLLLQAQRELAYTELGIKQIAFELGFADAAYFTRFFRQRTGQAPAAWRAARRRAVAQV